MSNVIKSYTIRYEPTKKMTLDYKDRDEELQAKRNQRLSVPQIDGGFEEGLKAIVVDPVDTEEEKRKNAELIIENAEAEAANIIEAAKKEAMRIKEDTLEKSRKQGYEDGLKKGSLEIERLKRDLLEQQRLQREEYKSILEGLEGQVSELIISLITKLTGIFVEDKSDIILYLVEKALANNDNKAEDYTIRVSRDDFEILSSKKDYIEGVVGRNIQIIVDGQLGKNQCLIETESKVINCSLDVQLNNLIKDLRLLSSI